ncbi:MAG: AAA-like domain-containing protein, partial [Firmicutes bacterium]|nr:AAA-like domain-containing protein [Bacillota bacterium]
MDRIFNVTGACDPKRHYMVDLTSRLEEIRKMIDRGDYFAINRGRQYGKTTTLQALADYLKDDYAVISLDFQDISSLSFRDEELFVAAFAEELIDNIDIFPDDIEESLNEFVERRANINSIQALFKVLKQWFKIVDKGVVMIIDEVDSASNNQVFLDFLAKLRAGYLKRQSKPTFQSVILAGVYDIRNIKRKIRLEEEHKHNSPWNIAADFLVDMDFSVEEIEGMLGDYEEDNNTGMDV